MTDIRKLAKFISGLKYADVPKNVLDTAKLLVLDTVGASLGARDNKQNKAVLSAYLEISGDNGKISAWGTGEKLPLLSAILINAMMGHTLELDDVHTNSKTHIGTVVVPAAWGIAEEIGASGEDFLLAVICGYETMARIGMGLGVSSHRNRGWHVTCTAGTFGAAAACAKLLGLDEDKTVYALGLAGTQSCGLWSFIGDGSSNKVLHPARAAVSGTEAAILSRAGMTGAEHVLDADDGGLFAAMSDEFDYSLVSKGLGETYELMFMDNKPYPCCRSTHCAIDGALALKNEYSITADDIESVEVGTYLVGNKQCGMSEGSRNPSKPTDAKFSTPFTVACSIIFGEVTLRQFEQEVIGDEAVCELVRRVRVISEDRFTDVYPDHWGCEVRILLKDGRKIARLIRDASGSVDNPLSVEQVKSKASALIRETCGEDTERIVAEVLGIAGAAQMPEI